MTLTLTHTFDDRVRVTRAGRTLFEYVYMPTEPANESPKPHLHPLCTLKGNPVTIYRPHDHVWHVGVMMTNAALSGQNFWGGSTYVRDEGYRRLNNVGRQQHTEWLDMRAEDEAVALEHRLAWVTVDEQRWIDERRAWRVAAIDPEAGLWVLEVTMALTNVRGEALEFGSPTTEGRPNAGYGGLFWRGPRDFTRCQVLAEGDLEGQDAIMGARATWVAFVGKHDGSLDRSTLVFLDHPENLRHPTQWFVRTEPYACASASFMFDEVYELPADETLSLKYRLVVADGDWQRDDIERCVSRFGGAW